jgi:hypothetical protein
MSDVSISDVKEDKVPSAAPVNTNTNTNTNTAIQEVLK